jgi:hypothetical protein
VELILDVLEGERKFENWLDKLNANLKFMQKPLKMKNIK